MFLESAASSHWSQIRFVTLVKSFGKANPLLLANLGYTHWNKIWRRFGSSTFCWNFWLSFIHPKRWFSWLQNSADNLNFPQKDCLRTRKEVSRLHCLQSYWRSFSLFMSSPWNKLSIKTLKHYILNKNATLTPNSCDFYDLRTFVGKFCRRDLRTFSAEFWRLKRRNPQTESLLECMIQGTNKSICT